MNWSKFGVAAAAAVMAAALSFAAPPEAQAKNDPIFQTAPLIPNDGVTQFPGAGLLYRTKRAIWANLSIQGLDANAGYTVWWVVFNNPKRCSVATPDIGAFCGEADLFDSKVNATVFYAAGFITGEDGTANVSAHLEDGRVPDTIDVVVGRNGIAADNGERPGLKRRNGLKAEVHMQVRSHGSLSDPVPDEEQISTFDPTLPEGADQVFVIFPGPGLE